MANGLEFNFSQTFTGVIWNTIAVPERDLLVIETRSEDAREARFSAFDHKRNAFLWREIILEEPWWVGITAASSNVLLVHLYHSMENPDDKGLIAFDINQQKILWQCDHFSFVCLRENSVEGNFTVGDKEPAVLNLLTGQIMDGHEDALTVKENISLLKPFQYVEGHPYFETVKAFLQRKLGATVVAAAEYLEHNAFIFISYYVKNDSLANYLVVVTQNGAIVQHEKIGEQLKGLGLETFFILSGSLFFVRNKRELVSFRLV